MVCDQSDGYFRFHVSDGDVQEALLLLPLCERLLLALARALLAAMKQDKAAGGKDGCSPLGPLVRGILGCVKVHVAAARFPHALLRSHFEGWSSPADRLFSLLAGAWRGTAVGTATGTATSTAEGSASEGALATNVAVLLKLLSRMQGGKQDAVCPFVAAIVGELLAAAPPAWRKSAVDDVWSGCAGRIRSPSCALAEALVRLFALQGPSCSPDRLRSLLAVTALVR